MNLKTRVHVCYAQK